MRRTLFLPVFSLFLAISLPAAAEEILLKDGTKIVGHMSALQADKIEVETAYGKMQLKRGDIIAINFPENGAVAAPGTPAAKDVALNIDESLRGTQYVNKTGKFTLTVPSDWKINQTQRSAPVVTALTSGDDMRFLLVAQEQYNGSLESYKGLLELMYRKTFGSYEELSQSLVKIDGKPGLLFSFRGISTKANNLPVQFLVAIVPSGTTYTRIATWCVEPLFHETQSTFEKIMTSYHSNGLPTLAQLAKP
ncbi:MAG: hypothetical protein JWO71_4433 [Candidatus Acidoferrum typicum]|nr:hypothetical protein [Candidatus Acidoferrum typicum]